LSRRSIEIAVALAAFVAASFLMGCAMEEDVADMGGPEEDEEPETGR
jgi:hypothetical protein